MVPKLWHWFGWRLVVAVKEKLCLLTLGTYEVACLSLKKELEALAIRRNKLITVWREFHVLVSVKHRAIQYVTNLFTDWAVMASFHCVYSWWKLTNSRN
jgi:hypothetical protein